MIDRSQNHSLQKRLSVGRAYFRVCTYVKVHIYLGQLLLLHEHEGPISFYTIAPELEAPAMGDKEVIQVRTTPTHKKLYKVKINLPTTCHEQMVLL